MARDARKIRGGSGSSGDAARSPAHAAVPLVGAALACLFSLGCDAAERQPPAGEILYAQHCSSCHGASGKGDGPVAPSLQVQPADLTTIARRAGGRFDQTAVLRIIDGRRIVAAHGERDMPVWGAVFAENVRGQRYADYKVLLDARALTDYIRSIQAD